MDSVFGVVFKPSGFEQEGFIGICANSEHVATDQWSYRHRLFKAVIQTKGSQGLCVEKVTQWGTNNQVSEAIVSIRLLGAGPEFPLAVMIKFLSLILHSYAKLVFDLST